MSALAVRVQEKGQVTIPRQIRQKLGIRKGDLVAFVETDRGVVIKPAQIIVASAFKEVGGALKKKGITLDRLMKRGRKIRGKLVEEEYGLTDHSSR